MLIYVNQLNLVGKNRTETAFRTIAGWLKSITGELLTTDQLMGSNEFKYMGNIHVRTYQATQVEPKQWAILFTHPDSSRERVKGRIWITEIGIAEYAEHTTLSILLETSDISTQVTTIPETTRPKLVSFIKQNATLDKDTIGKSVKYYTDSTESFKQIEEDIYRKSRTTPIVLVSNEQSGDAHVDSKWLQEQLFGLAQVYTTREDIDSWEMERVLTRRYCAWGGAINIIHPLKGRDNCRNQLLLRDKLSDLKEEGHNCERYILSLVTHSLNGYNKKKHFSPTDVRAKRQRDQRITLMKKFDEIRSSADSKELLDDALVEITELESVLNDLEIEHKKDLEEKENESLELLTRLDEMEIEHQRHIARVEELKYRIEQISDGNKLGTNDSQALSPQEIVDAICNLTKLTPEVCLNLVSKLYPSRVIILDSAFQSARDSRTFKNGPKLLNNLSKLVKEYLDKVQEGGDSHAKHVFGKAFSANESDTVEKNPKLRNLRKFKYNGNDVFMFKHIRIGTSRNPDETIRIHFHIDQDKNIIVIGYCGEHLPTSST